MKSLLPRALAALVTLSAAFAQEGRKFDKLLTYEDVVILKMEPDGIRVMHKGGIAKIAFERLPPELVAEFGLNPEDAELHRKNTTVAESEAATRQKGADFLKSRVTKLSGTILQVKEGGMLLSPAIFTTGKTTEIKIPYTIQEDGPTTLQPHRKPKLRKGYKTETVPETITVEAAWLSCDTKPYIDGMRFEKDVYTVGKFSYVGTDGAERTVPSFTTKSSELLAAAGHGAAVEAAKTPTGTSTGTGFFITGVGHLLTNNHVVEKRTKIEVQVGGRFLPAKVLKFDATNDIALLKVEAPSTKWLPLGEEKGVGLAKPVFTVGFPQVTVQGSSAKFTEGSVSSLSGANDDRRYFQISVPIQPGNSGSPLVDGTGKVVGIVSATLSSGVSERGLEINQNVNYALKISYAKSMLGSAFIAPTPLANPPKTREAIVQAAADAVVLIRAQ
ncbi:serine protease [Luteolibacter arcticus]|uniref:Serine protease n=1 Tax=Luteolibacter arcticus TaxID=1581411 RepID=A0ABT3GJV7_9BACT|nr:serine protease [Luteolibacter arcticus]MCW1923756.1 serine protease [Luteolibacter arcticus]